MASVDKVKLTVTVAVWAAFLILLILRGTRRLVSTRFAWGCIILFAVALLSLGPVNSSRHHQVKLIPESRE
jgi:hypothetical protein